MEAPPLVFGPTSPFDPEERRTLESLWGALAGWEDSRRTSFQRTIQAVISRVDFLSEALDRWPPVFGETELGLRRRNLDSLVDILAQATDASFDMFLPTQALVGRALLMAELNAWRLLHHVLDQARQGLGADAERLGEEVDRWLHGCVHVKIAEEILGAVTMDATMERRVRAKALEMLAHIWQNRLTYRVRTFFPLLEATWSARRRIRVSVGTMLGVSEIFRLIQAGCDPQFVEYFSRPRLTRDEREAFQEFLIGVPTEEIHSLEQLMAESGRSSLTPEETAGVGYRSAHPAEDHPGVRAYEFFRERYLSAAARRLKGLPGPKRTAEEYVMIYYLDQETARPSASKQA